MHAEKHKNILFFDDEESVIKALQRTVHMQDYRVYIATNDIEAFEMLKNHDVSVIVSDLKMPGMTGKEFLNIVRPEYPDIIRIMLTAFADAPTLIDMIHSKTTDTYLIKPCDNYIDQSMQILLEEADSTMYVQKQNHHCKSSL